LHADQPGELLADAVRSVSRRGDVWRQGALLRTARRGPPRYRPAQLHTDRRRAGMAAITGIDRRRIRRLSLRARTAWRLVRRARRSAAAGRARHALFQHVEAVTDRRAPSPR